MPLREVARIRALSRHGMVLVLLCTVVAGCSRLTFVKPDLGRGDFERTAPEVDMTPDQRGSGASGARVAVQRGQVALGQGDITAAAKLAREAVRLAPDSSSAHTLLAITADRLGDSRSAGKHYRTAVELAPQQGGMHNNYGAWLCGSGREQESLEWFENAVTLPGYRSVASALANAGSCAARAGLQDRAVGYLDAALERDPGNPVALEAMARLELDRGDAFRARAFAQRRLGVEPINADVLLLASQIEEKLGDREAAAGYVQRMEAEFPASSGSGEGE
ncbi:type IV pilus assembly protein PilF [Lysobacter spongiicola DSM 21749]|uniref:Type IV pilus assembly protein PilF n=2 Tax=Novilysobacter TaxID=3382699 RepID=A0A1T4LX44_9GAMM|nr:type IV pilus assembly protein PilF [Lysobacter spongiicola DSM 21749]